MLILMGINGSGKGTQGALLAGVNGYKVISTGEILRNYGSEEQHERMHAGEILGDQEVTDLLDKALAGQKDPNAVILDGYPRRISQSDWLLKQAKTGRFEVEMVLHLNASHEAVRARLLNRGRQDDRDDVIEERFREYERETAPIFSHLKDAGVPIAEIDGAQTIEAVHNDILAALKKAD